MTDLPTPSDLLGAGQFSQWYPNQYELLVDLLNWHHSDSRFLGVSAPTGSGKSLSALLLSHLSGERTVILTSSKGLQDQYQRVARLVGGVVLKGQNNFPCLLASGLRADEGPCHSGIPCSVRDQCPYRRQLKQALDSRLVITNYAYWLAQTNFSSGVGEVGLIILDESHQCFGAMENYLTIYLSRMDIQSCGVNFPESADLWSTWKTWAAAALPTVTALSSKLAAEVRSHVDQGQRVPGQLARTFRSVKSTAAKLDRLSTVGEEWVIQHTHHGYRFTPKWVSNYADDLFQAVPKVMLMSAVLSNRTLDYLGVPSNGNRSLVEVESYFPPANGPIYHVSTARINRLTDDFGATIWVSRIDQIIQRRLDRKGIVFPVSYERARLLMSRSRFKDIMFTHGQGDVSIVVERFKKAPPPAVLVSPTVTTGWDFPMLSSGHGIPQYGVVGKIPYMDTRDPVTKARSAEDKDWTSYMAMETLAQTAGRLNRSPDDVSEILVTDDSFRWFWPKYQHFAPPWLRARYQGSLDVVPNPLV